MQKVAERGMQSFNDLIFKLKLLPKLNLQLLSIAETPLRNPRSATADQQQEW